MTRGKSGMTLKRFKQKKILFLLLERKYIFLQIVTKYFVFKKIYNSKNRHLMGNHLCRLFPIHSSVFPKTNKNGPNFSCIETHIIYICKLHYLRLWLVIYKSSDLNKQNYSWKCFQYMINLNLFIYVSKKHL